MTARFAIIMLFASTILSCGEIQNSITDEEITVYAEDKASSIVYDYYNNFSFFSLSTEVLDSFFESENRISVQIKASYEWHTEKYLGWKIGYVDKQFKGDKTHKVVFQIVRDVDSLEKSIKYLKVNPDFEPPTAFSN